MRRAGTALVLLALLTASMPTRAAETFTGTILLPGGVEPMARLMYLADDGLNGVVGHVIDLDQRWPNQTPWALTETGGVEPLDMFVTYYSSISGSAQACNYLVDSDDGTTKLGRIECPDLNGNGQVAGNERARWAIVVMLPGLAGSFSLSVG